VSEKARPLSRAQKIELLAALDEKRKRQLRARPLYKPRPGQLSVLLSKAKNVFNFSGNGGGKTTLNVQMAWAIARGANPWTKERTRVPAKIIFVVDNARKIEERIIPEMRKWFDVQEGWLKRLGKPYTSRIEFDNGSVIDFYSSDADPSSFEGVEASAVLVDEPIPRPLYISLKRALRMKGHVCRFIFSGTAISQAWLRREVYEPWAKGELPDTECFRLSTEDNREHLAEGYIEDFSRVLSDAEKETRLHGGFFDSDALALAHLWKRPLHVMEASSFKYNTKWPCAVAIDPHTSKPHTAIMITSPMDNRIVAIKELRFKGNASQFAVALKEWMRGHTVIDIVSDSAGNAEGTALEGFDSFIMSLQKNGVNVRPTRFKEKSHEDLIGRLQEGLVIPQEPDQWGRTTPKLRVLSTLTALISDIEGATFQKNRMTGETLAKIDTSVRDHLSCLGYALATNLFADKLRRAAPVYRDDIAAPVAGPPRERQAARARLISNRRVRMARKALAASTARRAKQLS
jgi:hypothetical protein